MSDPAAAEAARPSRAEETRRERRLKRGAAIAHGVKLAVDEDKLDRRKFEYRHVNDRGGRMQQMAAQDWDPAPEAGEGASVSSVVVGTDGGKPYNAVLMRKYKDWYDEDQKAKQKPLDEIDAAIRGGTAHKQEADLKGDIAYTPDSVTNSIR